MLFDCIEDKGFLELEEGDVNVFKILVELECIG